MKGLRLVRVQAARDIFLTARLAEGIWSEHYEGMFEPGQIAYMLTSFLSEAAISRQILTGVVYKLAYFQDELVGYYAAERQKDRMLLRDIYLQKPFRGLGLARAMLDDILTQCQGLNEIYLYVNKQNADSIAAYERMGFSVTGEQRTDIGAGYHTDEYRMSRPLVKGVPQ